MKIYNTYRKRKRMRIILDIESESEIKDADNDENTIKAGSHKWSLHVFYNCLDLTVINTWIII